VPLQNKQIAVTNNIDDKLHINGDKKMLKIVFRNLVSNSIKFTSKNGSIKLSSSINGALSIHIEDNGIGMSGEELENINGKKYFTKMGTEKEAGSGLGLRICHELLNKLGGELEVVSEKGTGSIFTVKLPYQA
jgi:signal transduction histidine kinase